MENQFDVSRPIALRLRQGAEIATVRVRFPKDEEWLSRQRSRKIIIKQLGRGQSETTVPQGEDVDAALLATIRSDEGQPEVDAFEAQKLIEQLALAEVEDAVAVGATFEISMRVLGATVKHVLKMPSAKQVADYRRGFARVLDLPFGKQQLTLNLHAAAELYTTLAERTDGYVGPVPIVHKTVAVKAAIDALDMDFQGGSDENFA